MTSESLKCYEKLRHGSKRPTKNHGISSSLFNSNWSFSSDMHLTSELLAEVGVGVLDDDDDDVDSSSSRLNGHTSAKRNKENVRKRQSALAQLEPTPPGNNTSCTAPPKNKHHRSDASKKWHGDDQTPFKVRRRTRADSPAKQDAFANISDEIVLQIFKWLPKTMLINCAHTCKRWKLLSYDHSLWTRLNLGDQTLGPDALMHVLGRGVVALRLAKSDIQEPQDISLPLSFPLIDNQRFSKLQHLDLSMAVISQPALEGLLGVCNKLRNLSLEHCSLNDKICRCLSGNRKLEQLNLAMCMGLTAIGIKSILARCYRLTALNLAWTELSQLTVDTVIRSLPTELKQLNLSGCRQTLTDKHVQELVKNCHELQELDISDAITLTQISILRITGYAMELKNLALTRCYAISKESFKTLFICPKLQHLQIFGLFTSAEIDIIELALNGITINNKPFSDIARPTTGISLTSIWGLRVRD